jgi:tetratricopeptide (TPR) repeat protein
VSFAGPRKALSQVVAGEEFCQARGFTAGAAWLRIVRAVCLVQVGRLHEALALAEAILPDLEEAGDDLSYVEVAYVQALALLEINGSSGSVAAETLRAATRTQDEELIAAAQTVAALDCWADGRPQEARALLRDLLKYAGVEKTQWAASVHQAVGCAVGIDSIELARELVARVDAAPSAIPANQHSLLTARALIAHADREYTTAAKLFTEAAHRWEKFGSRLEHAHALLGLAHSLFAVGHEDDGRAQVGQALDLFTAIGADHRVQQCRALLEKGTESDPRTA